MSSMFWNLWQKEWLLYEKVEFDGPARRIYIHPDVTEISVKADIYSAWKRWVQLQNNAAFLPALRVTGGEPVGGGQFTGDIYFLTNGWQIVISHFVRVNGIIYQEDNNLSPFIILAGGGVYATVSSLAQSIETAIPVVTGDVSEIPAALQDIGTKTDNMVAAVSAQSSSVTAIDTRTMAISNAVTAQTATLTNHTTALDNIGAVSNAVALEVSGLTTDLSIVASDLSTVDGRTAAIANDVDAVASAVAGVDSDVAALSLEVNDLAATSNSINIAVGDVQSEQANQSALLSQLDTRTAGIANSVSEHGTKIDQLAASNAEIQTAIAELDQTSSLSPAQETMLLEMYTLLGLDPTKPLFVSTTSRVAGPINQTIQTDPTTKATTVTRQ